MICFEDYQGLMRPGLAGVPWLGMGRRGGWTCWDDGGTPGFVWISRRKLPDKEASGNGLGNLMIDSEVRTSTG